MPQLATTNNLQNKSISMRINYIHFLTFESALVFVFVIAWNQNMMKQLNEGRTNHEQCNKYNESLDDHQWWGGFDIQIKIELLCLTENLQFGVKKYIRNDYLCFAAFLGEKLVNNFSWMLISIIECITLKFQTSMNDLFHFCKIFHSNFELNHLLSRRIK